MAQSFYKELKKVKVSDTRNIVISECSKGGYTIAQQMEITEVNSDKPTTIFLKGALHIDDVKGLESLMNTLSEIINGL